MPPEHAYLVVIKPPRLVSTTGYTARDAARKADIQPGETAFVIKMSHVETFEWADLASLVEA